MLEQQYLMKLLQSKVNLLVSLSLNWMNRNILHNLQLHLHQRITCYDTKDRMATPFLFIIGKRKIRTTLIITPVTKNEKCDGLWFRTIMGDHNLLLTTIDVF